MGLLNCMSEELEIRLDLLSQIPEKVIEIPPLYEATEEAGMKLGS